MSFAPHGSTCCLLSARKLPRSVITINLETDNKCEQIVTPGYSLFTGVAGSEPLGAGSSDIQGSLMQSPTHQHRLEKPAGCMLTPLLCNETSGSGHAESSRV